jgi:predicted HAD superfamily Cof-like phosphohydrolase
MNSEQEPSCRHCSDTGRRPETEPMYAGWSYCLCQAGARLLRRDGFERPSERDDHRQDTAHLTHQELVEAFHRKFNLPVGDIPCIPQEKRIKLRLRLIAEEFFELLGACLIAPTLDDVENRVMRLIDRHDTLVALPEAIDALADLEYVIHGTAVECGVDMAPVFAEVHRANMAKEGGAQRGDGKILKPEGWSPPDIVRCLREQGW